MEQDYGNPVNPMTTSLGLCLSLTTFRPRAVLKASKRRCQ